MREIYLRGGCLIILLGVVDRKIHFSNYISLFFIKYYTVLFHFPKRIFYAQKLLVENKAKNPKKIFDLFDNDFLRCFVYTILEAWKSREKSVVEKALNKHHS